MFHFCDWSSIVFFSLQTITSQIKYHHSIDQTLLVPTPQISIRSNDGRIGIISGRPITRRTVRSTSCTCNVSCPLTCQSYPYLWPAVRLIWSVTRYLFFFFSKLKKNPNFQIKKKKKKKKTSCDQWEEEKKNHFYFMFCLHFLFIYFGCNIKKKKKKKRKKKKKKKRKQEKKTGIDQ